MWINLGFDIAMRIPANNRVAHLPI